MSKTDTIRVPISWKPLLTELKNSVTTERGEELLQAAIATLGKPTPVPLQNPITSVAPAPPEKKPEPMVTVMLRNPVLASDHIEGQRYRIDVPLELPTSTVQQIEAILSNRRAGSFGMTYTRLERVIDAPVANQGQVSEAVVTL